MPVASVAVRMIDSDLKRPDINAGWQFDGTGEERHVPVVSFQRHRVGCHRFAPCIYSF